MRASEFRERLLIALYLEARDEGLAAFLEPKEVADKYQLKRATGQLRLTVDDLGRLGLLNVSKLLGGGDEGHMSSRLTYRGIDEAERQLARHPEYGSPFVPQAPASDRYVTLDHNSRSTIEASSAALREAVRGENEADEESHEIALSEIAAFEATIAQSRVATELIERFVNKVLAWMMTTFGAAMVAAAAEALIAKLLPLIQHVPGA